jgi:biopolymer transport protein ExbD
MSGRGAEVKAEPNLTPILDMVFQLITFFMLVINFKSAELDLSLNLPIIGSARPVEFGTGRVLVLNIKDANGKPVIRHCNFDFVGEERVKQFIKQEGAASRLSQGLKQEDVDKGGKEIDEWVVLRADDATPFGHVNLVIVNCQLEGYRQFALKAMGSAAAAQAFREQSR